MTEVPHQPACTHKMMFLLHVGLSLAAPLLQPPAVRGDAVLRIDTGRVKADEFSFNARAYNGGSPGPTIRVQPGMRFTVTLQNTLGPGATNESALHMHGLHVERTRVQRRMDSIVRTADLRELCMNLLAASVG